MLRFLRARGERGQTMVEFAIICSVLLMLSAGLIDVGRGFFAYNAVQAAANYGARWGSVVGGTCDDSNNRDIFSSWCDQVGTYSSQQFWIAPGNAPTQSATYSCPDTGGQAGCCPKSGTVSGFTYYNVGDYTGANQTTIVGAIAHHFDTTNSSNHTVVGSLTPGLDLSKLKVCIQLPIDPNNSSQFAYVPGDTVLVRVYYPFNPVSALLGGSQMNLTASAQFVIE